MFNAPISEKQCLGPSDITGLNNKIGDPCDKGSTSPTETNKGEDRVGICTLMQT